MKTFGEVDAPLKAPFPWFGGKSRVADLVWPRFGADIPNYVEPFFGSGAVLLGRPGGAGSIETANDKDGYVSNFWRAVSAAPEEVAEYADYPIHECDLHARHVWLRAQSENLVPRLEGDPEWFDAKIAGWWVWGMALWIGSGFCGSSGAGPWVVEDGQLVRSDAGQGVKRELVHLGNAGVGVMRSTVADQPFGIAEWFGVLSDRIRRVRFCCGDFERVLGPTPTFNQGMTGVFLDPPYAVSAGRNPNCYNHDEDGVSERARRWAVENGANPLLRIALCGYEGEHEMPDGWECVAWKALGGYGRQNKNGNENQHRERIWFSPHCLRPGTVSVQTSMFWDEDEDEDLR